jgi:hypothetical protein
MAKALFTLWLIALLIKQSTSFQPVRFQTVSLLTSSDPRIASHSVPYNNRNTHKCHLAQKKDNSDETNDSNKIMGVFTKNPGTIIMIPFVALFGLDLIANIAVVTKRSLEGTYVVYYQWD